MQLKERFEAYLKEVKVSIKKTETFKKHYPKYLEYKKVWAKLNKKRVAFVVVMGVGILFLATSLLIDLGKFASASIAASRVPHAAFPVVLPEMAYGIELTDKKIIKDTIRPNQFFSDMVKGYDFTFEAIENMARKSKDVFDVRSLRAGKEFSVISSPGDSLNKIEYLIYEPSPYEYVVYDFTDTLSVYKVEHPVDIQMTSSVGIIESSLWNALVGNGMSWELASKMEDALAWSVDFHHIQKGDYFKLIYEENYIEGKKVGVGNIKGAYFNASGTEYYAFKYKNDKYDGFYDEEARPMKRAFLKAPVKYSRISSGYNLRRFHPVLRRVKAHLGTDYAAPRGTPIMAVANGVVTRASYGRGNGKYVKIKHDKVYQTQYLHMSKFGPGIKAGVHVKQGQVIGYVGSTGLATGPHVCFRFWKHGRQVNHRRENFPPPDPMAKEEIPEFNKVRDKYKVQLDALANPEMPMAKLESKGDSVRVLP